MTHIIWDNKTIKLRMENNQRKEYSKNRWIKFNFPVNVKYKQSQNTLTLLFELLEQWTASCGKKPVQSIRWLDWNMYACIQMCLHPLNQLIKYSWCWPYSSLKYFRVLMKVIALHLTKSFHVNVQTGNKAPLIFKIKKYVWKCGLWLKR